MTIIYQTTEDDADDTVVPRFNSAGGNGENLINKYLKCRKLNKELADAFVDKVQVFEDGRISVNLVYDDCLEELLQVKNKREGDLYE